MRTDLLLVITGLLLVPVGACDHGSKRSTADGGNGGGDGSTVTMADLCQAICGRQQRCATASSPVDPACVQNCMADGPAPGICRNDSLATMRDCFQTLACGTSDDECTVRAVAQADPNWQQNAEIQSCLAMHAACDASGVGGFVSDTCVLLPILTDAAHLAFSACFQKACALVQACLDAAMKGQ